MYKKYNGTGIIINMDKYYTSPSVMILLCNRGLFASGTVLKNRHMAPSQIILTTSETATLTDGYARMAVCEFTKMMAFGWNDKNPVHFVSTVDGTEARLTVRRQRKNVLVNVSCPTTRLKQEHAMGGL
jgi:hypothetical protein